MPTRDGKLGVGVSGIGWCAAQHIAAFQKNPHVARDVAPRPRRRAGAGHARRSTSLSLPDARLTTRYEDLLEAPDVDIISIATPNHLHAGQAVAAARAGKHIVLEKPTGLDEAELCSIRDAVRAAGVRTIVSFELRYNPYLKFARWLRESGWLGELRFARTQYLSRVTDWYPGWNWVRTTRAAAAATCSRPAAMPSMRCAGARAAKWSRSARFIPTSPPATSGRRRSSSTRGWRGERSAT